MRYLKQGNYNLDNISKNDVAVETLTGANYVSPAPITLMYQAGYLTIKEYNPEFGTYNLDYPNEEVKRGFMHSLSQLFAPALIEGNYSVYQFIRDLRGGDTRSFMDRLTAFFAGSSIGTHAPLGGYLPDDFALRFSRAIISFLESMISRRFAMVSFSIDTVFSSSAIRTSADIFTSSTDLRY